MFSNSSRRLFLTQGMGLVGLAGTVPSFLVRGALAGPKAESDQRVLVVVQLSGGHDGLSAVVPYGNDEYAKNRRDSRISAGEVLKINDEIGLHPNLKAFKNLLDQHAFGIVQGVGYPNPNQSHFTSMDIWHLADPTARTNSTAVAASHGWLGKYTDAAFKNDHDPKLVMAVGQGRAPLAIQGKAHPGISFQVPDSFRYTGDRGDKARAEAYRKLNDAQAMNAPADNMQFVTQTAANANACSQEIRDLATKYKTQTKYPNSSLASSLHTVASLIAGGLSSRVYYVFHGGYDTHAGQRQRHDRLMTELGEAIGAFQKDLAQQGNDKRVLTMSFSEFGRRLDENFSSGTDHGMAAPMFLVGPSVKPGLHGRHPSLKKEDLVLGRDLKFTTDFRSVYATILEKWLSTPHESVIGTRMELLDLIA